MSLYAVQYWGHLSRPDPRAVTFCLLSTAPDRLLRSHIVCVLARYVISRKLVDAIFNTRSSAKISQEFLATDTEVPGSIPGATRFSEK
jgi:hypothetical protein